MAQGKSVPNLEAGSLLDADTSALPTIGRSCELQAYEIEHMFYGYSPRGLADQSTLFLKRRLANKRSARSVAPSFSS